MRFNRIILPIALFIAVAALALFVAYRDTTEAPRFTAEDFSGQTFQAVAQRIAEATVDGGAPGTIVHIRHNGVVYTSAAGVANKTTGQAIALDTPLRIASVSKVYTAAIIHALVAEGRLSLDTPIVDILPHETLQGIPNADQTTVRHLLLHTSGIPDYYDIRSYLFSDWREPITLDRMLPVIRRHDATGPAGAGYAYSNSGYLLLGEIAEAVSGQAFEDLVSQVILAPLALKSTYYSQFQPVETDIHGYGTYLRPWKDTHEYFEHSGPDGGIMASAADVSAFLDALMISNGPLREMGDQMMGDFVQRSPRGRQGLGIETIMARSGEELFGHTGDVFGYQTVAYVYPDRGIVVVGQVNCNCAELSLSLITNLHRAVEAIDGPFRGDQ